MNIIILKADIKTYDYNGLVIDGETDLSIFARAAGFFEGDIIAEINCLYRCSRGLFNSKFTFKSTGPQGNFKINERGGRPCREDLSIVESANNSRLKGGSSLRKLVEMFYNDEIESPTEASYYLPYVVITKGGNLKDVADSVVVLEGDESDFKDDAIYISVQEIVSLVDNNSLLSAKLRLLHEYIEGFGTLDDSDDDEVEGGVET